MDYEDVMHIHNGIFYVTARNTEIMQFTIYYMLYIVSILDIPDGTVRYNFK